MESPWPTPGPVLPPSYPRTDRPATGTAPAVSNPGADGGAYEAYDGSHLADASHPHPHLPPHPAHVTPAGHDAAGPRRAYASHAAPPSGSPAPAAPYRGRDAAAFRDSAYRHRPSDDFGGPVATSDAAMGMAPPRPRQGSVQGPGPEQGVRSPPSSAAAYGGDDASASAIPAPGYGPPASRIASDPNAVGTRGAYREYAHHPHSTFGAGSLPPAAPDMHPHPGDSSPHDRQPGLGRPPSQAHAQADAHAHAQAQAQTLAHAARGHPQGHYSAMASGAPHSGDNSAYRAAAGDDGDGMHPMHREAGFMQGHHHGPVHSHGRGHDHHPQGHGQSQGVQRPSPGPSLPLPSHMQSPSQPQPQPRPQPQSQSHLQSHLQSQPQPQPHSERRPVHLSAAGTPVSSAGASTAPATPPAAYMYTDGMAAASSSPTIPMPPAAPPLSSLSPSAIAYAPHSRPPVSGSYAGAAGMDTAAGAPSQASGLASTMAGGRRASRTTVYDTGRRKRRHNLKLPLAYRVRFDVPYDEGLQSLLQGLHYVMPPAPWDNATLATARLTAHRGSDWTIWVSDELQQQFHCDKARWAPRATHGEFIELLLQLRDAEAHHAELRGGVVVGMATGMGLGFGGTPPGPTNAGPVGPMSASLSATPHSAHSSALHGQGRGHDVYAPLGHASPGSMHAPHVASSMRRPPSPPSPHHPMHGPGHPSLSMSHPPMHSYSSAYASAYPPHGSFASQGYSPSQHPTSPSLAASHAHAHALDHGHGHGHHASAPGSTSVSASSYVHRDHGSGQHGSSRGGDGGGGLSHYHTAPPSRHGPRIVIPSGPAAARLSAMHPPPRHPNAPAAVASGSGPGSGSGSASAPPPSIASATEIEHRDGYAMHRGPMSADSVRMVASDSHSSASFQGHAVSASSGPARITESRPPLPEPPRSAYPTSTPSRHMLPPWATPAVPHSQGRWSPGPGSAGTYPPAGYASSHTGMAALSPSPASAFAAPSRGYPSQRPALPHRHSQPLIPLAGSQRSSAPDERHDDGGDDEPHDGRPRLLQRQPASYDSATTSASPPTAQPPTAYAPHRGHHHEPLPYALNSYATYPPSQASSYANVKSQPSPLAQLSSSVGSPHMEVGPSTSRSSLDDPRLTPNGGGYAAHAAPTAYPVDSGSAYSYASSTDSVPLRSDAPVTADQPPHGPPASGHTAPSYHSASPTQGSTGMPFAAAPSPSLPQSASIRSAPTPMLKPETMRDAMPLPGMAAPPGPAMQDSYEPTDAAYDARVAAHRDSDRGAHLGRVEPPPPSHRHDASGIETHDDTVMHDAARPPHPTTVAAVAVMQEPLDRPDVKDRVGERGWAGSPSTGPYDLPFGGPPPGTASSATARTGHLPPFSQLRDNADSISQLPGEPSAINLAPYMGPAGSVPAPAAVADTTTAAPPRPPSEPMPSDPGTAGAPPTSVPTTAPHPRGSYYAVRGESLHSGGTSTNALASPSSASGTNTGSGPASGPPHREHPWTTLPRRYSPYSSYAPSTPLSSGASGTSGVGGIYSGHGLSSTGSSAYTSSSGSTTGDSSSGSHALRPLPYEPSKLRSYLRHPQNYHPGGAFGLPNPSSPAPPASRPPHPAPLSLPPPPPPLPLFEPHRAPYELPKLSGPPRTEYRHEPPPLPPGATSSASSGLSSPDLPAGDAPRRPTAQLHRLAQASRASIDGIVEERPVWAGTRPAPLSRRATLADPAHAVDSAGPYPPPDGSLVPSAEKRLRAGIQPPASLKRHGADDAGLSASVSPLATPGSASGPDGPSAA
ncbi:hypothetical protein CXG81DRAFT_16247 [Caulochytrium protostelioides]|uniref:Uncharacterized protein n=1 Tax=Caulochytrium protostelioides TaxID=1555241 RepID=A0A4P9XFA8_9FUNG|nr:hypothetical protein CXG81DRAFT_16247 [Caulochytrium protostelioides]|eukprot:RKP04265.1 hypothetical protein CXG81DRAFT_16247 [Caulochytrium protostelioides]